MYVNKNNGHKTGVQEANVTKKKEKVHINLTTSLKTIYTPPSKMSYTNSPSKNKTTLKLKTTPLFCHE